MTQVWPETDDPAVVAMVDHFVNEGFDPDGAEYVEIAMTALMGLYVAGFTVTPWPKAGGGQPDPGIGTAP